MTGRVIVIASSPRVAPGLLSWPAWQALHAADVVLAEPDHPQAPAVLAAGVAVHQAALSVRDVQQRALEGATVALLSSDAQLVRALGLLGVRGGAPLEVVQGSFDLPGARLLDVVAVMDRLRSPGGCPWDAEQTHTSLMPYLVEEAYEAYQALEDGDLTDLREELGDVLLQVVFHARVSSETGWDIDDVAGDLVDKLVRRHPHVYAGTSAEDLEGTWEALKQAEKGRASVTDGVPLSQPALLLAAKLQKRASRLGAPAVSYDGLGGALWDLVARCRAEGVDPEAALRTTARGFRDRLAEAEAQGELPTTGADWIRVLGGVAP